MLPSCCPLLHVATTFLELSQLSHSFCPTPSHTYHTLTGYTTSPCPLPLHPQPACQPSEASWCQPGACVKCLKKSESSRTDEIKCESAEQRVGCWSVRGAKQKEASCIKPNPSNKTPTLYNTKHQTPVRLNPQPAS